VFVKGQWGVGKNRFEERVDLCLPWSTVLLVCAQILASVFLQRIKLEVEKEINRENSA